MNYDDMSDFEVNLKLAKLVLRGQHINYLPQDVCDITGIGYDHVDIVTERGTEQRVNFCGLWADVGQLIEEYKVFIINDNDCSYAGVITHFAHGGLSGTFDFESDCVEDVNPKRAAAICIIKMKDGER